MPYSVADRALTTLTRVGYPLKNGARFLDIGCGAGWSTYEFRDKGYDAYGFDIHDGLEYREPSDRQHFGFCDYVETDTANVVVQGEFRRHR